MTTNTYPGDTATKHELYELAVQFHTVAEVLILDKLACPARLLALQAIEGYLIAYARHIGRSNSEVRQCRHDVAQLADIGADNGLALRGRVHIHLKKIVQNREYLVARYGPEANIKLSQATELQSTMNELARKVGSAIGV